MATLLNTQYPCGTFPYAWWPGGRTIAKPLEILRQDSSSIELFDFRVANWRKAYFRWHSWTNSIFTRRLIEFRRKAYFPSRQALTISIVPPAANFEASSVFGLIHKISLSLNFEYFLFKKTLIIMTHLHHSSHFSSVSKFSISLISSSGWFSINSSSVASLASIWKLVVGKMHSC